MNLLQLVMIAAYSIKVIIIIIMDIFLRLGYF